MNKSLLTTFFKFGLAGVLFGYIFISYSFKIPIVNQKVVSLIEEELTRSFDQKVTIESLEGTPFSTVLLSNVRIENTASYNISVMADIQRVNVHLNLPSILINKEFSQGLYRMDIDGVTINIVRNDYEQWNVLNFVKPKNNGQRKSMFSGVIQINDVNGAFIDQKGWGKDKTQFIQEFHKGIATIDFSNREAVALSFQSLFSDFDTRAMINGVFNSKVGGFKYQLDVKNLNTKTWGPYLFPFKQFQVYDDTISIQGYLKKKQKIVPNEMSFYYDLNIGYNQLSFSMPYINFPLEQINGTLNLNNHKDREIRLLPFFATVNGSPVEGRGAINLDQRTIDISFSTKELESKEQVVAIFPFFKVPFLDFDASLDVGVKGALKSPEVTTRLVSDQVTFYDYEFGRLSMDLLIKDGQLHLQSMSDSDTFLSGTVYKNKHLDIHLTRPNMTIPSVDSMVTMNMHIYGNKVSPKLEFFVDHVQKDLYGFTIDSVFADIDMVPPKGVAELREVIFRIDNGQTMRYSGKLFISDMQIQLKQMDLTRPEQMSMRPNSSANLSSMKSNILLKRRDNQWVKEGWAYLSGNGLKYGMNTVDFFNVNVVFNHSRVTLDIKDLKLDNDKHLKGKLLFSGTDILAAKLNMKQFPLSFFNSNVSHIDQYALDGMLTGDVDYQLLEIEDVFTGAFIIDDFKTAYGDFGQLEVQFSREKGVVDVKSLSLRGIHDAQLFGVINDRNDLEFKIYGNSFFNLDYISFLNERGFSGFLDINGTFKLLNEDVSFEGNVGSRKLNYGDLELSKISADLILNNFKVDINDAQISIDDGDMLFSGTLYSNDRNIWNEQFKSIEYDLKFDFNDFDMAIVPRVINAYENMSLKDTQGNSKPLFDQFDIMLYSKYYGNKLDQFNRFLDEQLPQHDGRFNDLKGILNGRFGITSVDKQINDIFLDIDSFQLTNQVSAKTLRVVSGTVNDSTENINLTFGSVRHFDSEISNLFMKIQYDRDKGAVSFLNSSIDFNQNEINNFIRGSIYFVDKNMNLSILLRDQDINLISFFLPKIASINNEGVVKGSLKGPFDAVVFESDEIVLKNFKLNFNSDKTIFNSPFTIDTYQTKVVSGEWNFSNTPISWKGNDTFRRVTRQQKLNQFTLSGKLQILPLNFTEFGWLEIDYDLQIQPTFLSINLPQFYVGDVFISDSKFVGRQILGISKSAKQEIRDQLGTRRETGPTLVSTLTFQDGLIHFPEIGSRFYKPRILLDTTVIFGSGVFVEGGLFGGGLYNLANNIYLEVDDRDGPISMDVSGSLNSPEMDVTIDFYSGSITIFDGVYELMTVEQQQHYFQEFPDYQSDQFVRVQMNYNQLNDKNELDYYLNLRALRVKDQSVTTENIETLDYPYQSIVLMYDGQLRDMNSAMNVMDYGIDNPYSLYPSFELNGQYHIDFSDDQSLNDQSYYALNLLLPSIVTDAEDATFSQLGRQQVNNIFRSSIRPYERRLAKRIGLYDLRVDYDLGNNVFPSDIQTSINQDLLGVYFIADLYRERLFLNLRTDVDLSAEEEQVEKGVKITQFELKYYLLRNFNVSLKNVNEYSEITSFDPRFALNYGYSF